MSNGDEAMSPEEFAKLMGAYPEPSGNPLPAYGGYMDNSPANFAWVNNNDYFGAESKTVTSLPKDYIPTQEELDELNEASLNGDLHFCDENIIHDEENHIYLCDVCGREGDDMVFIDTYFDNFYMNKKPSRSLEYGAEVHLDGSPRIHGHRKCDCDRCERGREGFYPNGWTCQDTGVVYRYKDADTDLTPTNQMNNSIGQVVPITNPMELPTNLIETEAGGGPEGQITPDVFSAETEVFEGVSECDNCGERGWYGSNLAGTKWEDQPVNVEPCENDHHYLCESCIEYHGLCPECNRCGLCGTYDNELCKECVEGDGEYACVKCCAKESYHAETFEATHHEETWTCDECNQVHYEKEDAVECCRCYHDSAELESWGHAPRNESDTSEIWFRCNVCGARLTAEIHVPYTGGWEGGRHYADAETFEAESAKRYWLKNVEFRGNSKMVAESGGNPFYPDGLFTSGAAAKRDLQKMLEIAKDLPEVRISIGSQYYSDYQQPLAQAAYRWRTKHKGTDHRTTYHGFSVWLPYGHYQITYEAVTKLGAETFEAPYGGLGAIMDIGKSTPLADFTDEELTTSSAIHGDFDQASLNYSGHQNIEVKAEDEEDNSYCANCLRAYTYDEEDDAYIMVEEGDEFYTDENYGVLCRECHPDFQHEDRFGNWTRKRHLAVRPYSHEKDAEMDIVAEGMAVVSNVRDDVVGVVEVIDDEDDDEMVEISIQDENMEEIGSFTLDDGQIMDDYDDYLAESKLPSVWSLGLGAVAAILAFPYLKEGVSKVFSADNDIQEVLENDPEVIENPDTGDLDPAAYEELVVESTGYAVDVIPMGLDGSFMGSRFAALPTERYVDYNDPGIGAHIDAALDRDELFLEPEMAMVQAAEGDTVVKETQAPGQSPYFQMGQEPADMNYRVIKETHPISLDPAVKPFIPQSMTGYTGNANTPPSVMNKMFNIGVLGQTPLFVPGQSDMGANHFGSRDAQPDMLGLGGSVGGPLSDQVNLSYTDGTTSMSLAQWAIENTVSQSSDTEAVVIDRSSGAMKRIRRV